MITVSSNSSTSAYNSRSDRCSGGTVSGSGNIAMVGSSN